MTEQDPKATTPAEVTAPKPTTPQLTEEELSKASGGDEAFSLNFSKIEVTYKSQS
jgi:hypothetical protein